MSTSANKIPHIRVAAPSTAPGKGRPAAGVPKKEQSVGIEHPLSPFMFPKWYRFQITSFLSILHRLTGIALTVGSILLAWWLVAVAAGGEVFAATHAVIASPIGLALLFGWSVALFYHLSSGIRHLLWDAGYGFDLKNVYRSGYTVLVATVLLTLLAWLYVFLA
jgi:succinate dehydrogenase / fumarate reductase cytochrome b subunit